MSRSELALPVPEEWLEAVAARVAELLADREPHGPVSPYFTPAEAAEYLRSDRQRVYDLLSAGRLTRFKDGSRVLVARSELERYLGVDTPAGSLLATRDRGARR
jgi:excisionase family DNA binding protein